MSALSFKKLYKSKQTIGVWTGWTALNTVQIYKLSLILNGHETSSGLKI